FEFPTEKLLIFIREMLEEKRYGELLPLLERYSRGLAARSAYIRLSVCDTLGHVAGFVTKPGVSPEIEQLLAKSILNHFVHETDPKIRTSAAEAVASLVVSYIKTGRTAAGQTHLA